MTPAQEVVLGKAIGGFFWKHQYGPVDIDSWTDEIVAIVKAHLELWETVA